MKVLRIKCNNIATLLRLKNPVTFKKRITGNIENNCQRFFKIYP